MAVKVKNSPPELQYHLLKCALDRYGKNPANLSSEEQQETRLRASKSFYLENLVLSSAEAAAVVVSEKWLDQATRQIADRYNSDEELQADLKINGLNTDLLKRALSREFIFDTVMQQIGSKAAQVSDLDIDLFYEMHRDRFWIEETREARHILITINDQFVDNRRHQARHRIEIILATLRELPDQFSNLAKQHSECPTALEGGKLGNVRLDSELYPILKDVLFSLNEGEISEILESELGFHILLCEHINPAHEIPLDQARSKIRATLEQRRQHQCRKHWLSQLRQKTGKRRPE